MKMFMSIIKCFVVGTIENYKSMINLKLKICFRCSNEDKSLNCICMNCKFAVYCNKKCLRKNYILHETLCGFYLDNVGLINSLMAKTVGSFITYEQDVGAINLRKKNDNKII